MDGLHWVRIGVLGLGSACSPVIERVDGSVSWRERATLSDQCGLG